MMELPRRHAASFKGSRFAPNNSSVYGGRPWTGPSPEDLSVHWLAEWLGLVNEKALACLSSNSTGRRLHPLVSIMSGVRKKTMGSLAGLPVQVVPRHSQ